MSATRLTPDLVLRARRCHTLGTAGGRAEVVAIRAGRIVAVGPRKLATLAGRGTRVLDLGDACLTPGLVDAHTHFFYWALGRALVIDLDRVPTLEAALTRIRSQAVRKRVGDWVVGSGFDKNVWGDGFPHAADLDRAVSDRPAMIRARDGHTVWLNTPALNQLGITGNTPDPPGGCYRRDSHGQPTGIVQETAVDLLPNPLRELAQREDSASLRAVDRALAQAYAKAWSLGLVGVHAVDDDVALLHYQRHHQARRLGIRVVYAVPRANLSHAEAIGLRSGLGDNWLRIAGVKLFTDGSLGSQTAYMFEAYPGQPGNHGMGVLVGQELTETVVDAARHGWDAWIHAIGDHAVHDATAAIAAARRIEETPLAHRIEHAQCVRPADIRRMVRLGIIASVQPCHILGDIRTADRYWPRARRNAYALRRMLDSGVTLAAGSDAPIESLDPRRSFFAATCRTDTAGDPPGGWFADQKITAREVLRAFTVGAAAASGQAPPAGTLAPGAPADLTIWREDPLDVAPERLLDIGIAGCVVGGEVHLTEGV